MRKSLPINSARSLTASFSITTTTSALSVSPNDYRRRQIRRAKTFVYVLLFSIPVMLLLLYLFVVIMPERPTKAVETTTAKAKFTSHAALRRLPSGLIPNWYNISIQVYLPYRPGIDFGQQNFTVGGEVTIYFTCIASMSLLQLHAKEIVIFNDSIIIEEELSSGLLDGKPRRERIDVTATRGIFESDMVELKVARPFLRGSNYTIHLKYRAKMLSYMHAGLYVSAYQNGNETRYIAATQMQPLDARRLLPCFDEPRFKAKFAITVTHPSGTNVVSNNQAKRIAKNTDAWTVTEFEPTPRMSTYLLAMVISDFPYRETKFENVTIRIWAESSKLNDTTHALTIIPMYLEYFQNYFNIPYPLPKLDIFAVPMLRVIAMENWGLIICRQKILVYNEHLLGERDKQSVTDVLSHELAHMWFGDLVTMEWWNDLWLNEGFATLMSFKASCAVENSTSRNRQLFFENSARAMRQDQFVRETHPLSSRLDSKRGELYMFSRITYSKAAAVLQMVEEAVGEDVFRDGLRRFLNRYAYGNANRDDLLNSLNEVVEIERREAFSNVNFSLFEFMDSWVYQLGFPLVELERETGSSKIYAKQRFFKMDQLTTDFDHYRWKIPIFTKNSSHETSDVIWLEENSTVPLNNFLILDFDAKGYYRINYDLDNWNRITNLFITNHQLIPPASRARILDDAFMLAKIGQLPFRIPLRMCEYLRREDAYMPFLVFSTHFDSTKMLLRKMNIKSLEGFSMRRIDCAHQESVFKLWEHVQSIPRIKKPPRNNTMREFITYRICMWGYLPCISEAKRKFQQLRNDCDSDKKLSDHRCNSISPDLRTSVYSTAIRFGDYEDYVFLEHKYTIEDYHTERDRIYTGLAATTNKTTMFSMLNKLFKHQNEDSDIRQMILEWTRSSMIDTIMNYMRENFGSIYTSLKSFPQILKHVVTFFIRFASTDEELMLIEKFEKDYSSELWSVRLTKYITDQKWNIQQNIYFVKTYSGELIKYFDEYERNKAFIP